MNSKKISLSLVVNTRNESLSIKKCIQSVGTLADEIIIMDMESTDDTVKIAESLGAKVFKHKHVGYVEPARQAALEKAKGDWILLLDADEYITPQLKKKIKEIINKDDFSSVIAIARKNNIFGQWFRSSDYWPNYQVRLFKKGAVTWPAIIHASPEIKGDVYHLSAEAKLSLHHDTRVSADTFLAKTDSYTNFETSFLTFVKEHGFTGESVARYSHDTFFLHFFDQNGKDEKMAGYIMSKLMEVYRYAEIAKYWLKNDKPAIDDWDVFVKQLEQEYSYKRSYFYKLWLHYSKLKNFFN